MHVARLAVWVYWVYLIYCSENALRMQLYYMQSDARPQFSNQMIVFIRIPFQFLSVWCCWEKLRAFVSKAWTDDTTDHKANSRHNLIAKRFTRPKNCIMPSNWYVQMLCQDMPNVWFDWECAKVESWSYVHPHFSTKRPKKGTFVATQRKASRSMT